MNESKEKTAAKMILTRYLSEHKMRKTPERFALLDRIFETPGHFDVDALYVRMKEDGYPVSKATVYNNMQMLINAGLVRKHQFGTQAAQYERVSQISEASHHHMICRVCGKVREVRDSDAIRALEQRQYPSFKAEYVTLYVYGICSKCSTRRRGKS